MGRADVEERECSEYSCEKDPVRAFAPAPRVVRDMEREGELAEELGLDVVAHGGESAGYSGAASCANDTLIRGARMP